MDLLHTTAYLITLRNRRDRLRYAEKQLQKIGWTYELFEADKPLEAAGYVSPGARGCTESHFTLLQRAADAGNAPILIMEDDLKPCEDFQDAVRHFHQQVHGRLEAIDLVYYYNHTADGKKDALLGEPTLCTHFYIAMNPRKLLTIFDQCTTIDLLYMDAINRGLITSISPGRQIVAQNLKCGTDLGASHEEFKRRIGNFNDIFVNG